jgi:hypothetical protein
MKAIASIIIIALLLVTNSCIEDDGPFIKGNGEVVINVTTRGSYQFLIRYKNQDYYPGNLPEEFKIVRQEPIPVFIKFTLTEEDADIFTPGADDGPVFLKSIPVIRLVEIKRL